MNLSASHNSFTGAAVLTDGSESLDFRESTEFRLACAAVLSAVGKRFASIREIKQRLEKRKIIVSDCWLNECLDSLRRSGEIERNCRIVKITRYRLGGRAIEPLPLVKSYGKDVVFGARKRPTPTYSFDN